MLSSLAIASGIGISIYCTLSDLLFCLGDLPKVLGIVNLHIFDRRTPKSAQTIAASVYIRETAVRDQGARDQLEILFSGVGNTLLAVFCGVILHFSDM